MRLNRSVDMINGPLYKNIWIYSIPIILSGVLQLLFNAADLVVVGRFCGSVSVAAVGATGAIIGLVTNLFIGLSVGVGVVVATSLGAKNDNKVKEAVHTCLPVAFISGIFLTIIGIILTYPLLRLMKNPADVIDLSALYMKIYFCGMTSSLVFNYGAAILRAKGDTNSPLVYLTIAGVANVILNVLFVVAFKLDVAGVALATAITQTLSAVLVVLKLMRDDGPCKFILKEMTIKKDPLIQIIRIGLPAGIQSSLFSISNVIIQSSINQFESIVMAGNAAAQNVEGFVFTAMNAFNHTAQNFVGQNFGAKKLDRIPKIRKYCLLNVMLVGEGMGIPMYLAATKLLSIYLPEDPESIKYGIVRMSFICIFYGLNGLHDVSTGIIRGLGVSFVPMVVTVFGICVFRIIWIFTLFQIPQYHTLQMLYVTYPISWIITFAMLSICYKIVYKNKLAESKQNNI